MREEINETTSLRAEENNSKPIEILKKAEYDEVEDGVYVLDGDYEVALSYFDADAGTTEFLEKLDDDEKENLHFQSVVNIHEKYAVWRMGHWRRNTSHLPQLGNGIDNTTDVGDDYESVIEWAKSISKEVKA